jgi:hypothetical protein
MHIETAIRLKEFAGDRQIPVRCDIKRIPGKEKNVGGHFSRGSIVGIVGNQVQIKPYRHGGKIEVYSPEYVNLWTSRAIQNGVLTQQQIDEAENATVKPNPVEVTQLNDEQKELQTKLEQPVVPTVDANPSEKDAGAKGFVIADMGYEKDNIVYFYSGRGSTALTDKIDHACVYMGDMAKVNASRSMGQMKYRNELKKAVSDWRNLKVMSREEAIALCEEMNIKREEIATKPEVRPELKPVELSQPKVVDKIPEQPKVVDKIEVTPSSQAAIMQMPDVQSSLGNIQQSMSNVQAAIDILREERQNLLNAQKVLIESVTANIFKTIGKIDEAVTQGNNALSGKV